MEQSLTVTSSRGVVVSAKDFGLVWEIACSKPNRGIAGFFDWPLSRIGLLWNKVVAT